MFRTESVHHQVVIQDEQQVKFNDMPTCSTVGVFFCIISYHIYHYNKTVVVKCPLLRILQKNTTKVLHYGMSVHYCFCCCVQWPGVESSLLKGNTSCASTDELSSFV
jgi:hypothetical protein